MDPVNRHDWIQVFYPISHQRVRHAQWSLIYECSNRWLTCWVINSVKTWDSVVIIPPGMVGHPSLLMVKITNLKGKCNPTSTTGGKISLCGDETKPLWFKIYRNIQSQPQSANHLVRPRLQYQVRSLSNEECLGWCVVFLTLYRACILIWCFFSVMQRMAQLWQCWWSTSRALSLTPLYI